MANNILVQQKSLKSFKMYIDGVEIEGVTNFEYTNSVDEVPSIRLELICFGELEIDLERGI